MSQVMFSVRAPVYEILQVGAHAVGTEFMKTVSYWLQLEQFAMFKL